MDLSQLTGKIPVFGLVLKHALDKLGFGFRLDPNHVARAVFLNPAGEGFYLETKGRDIFLDPRRK